MNTLLAPFDVKVARVLRRDGDVVYKGQVLFYAASVSDDDGDEGTPIKAPSSGTLKYNQEMRRGVELKEGDEILEIISDDAPEDVPPPTRRGGKPAPERDSSDDISDAPVRDNAQVVWGNSQDHTPRPPVARAKKKKKVTRRPIKSAPPASPLLRTIGVLWMLAGSGLFFVLARYHYDYLGQLIEMARSVTAEANLDHISAVHGFYTKTYIANMSLGVMAVFAGVSLAVGRERLARLVISLWILALAVSQGLTLYVMYADNILLETYLKGALLVGAALLLYLQRPPQPTR